MPAWLASVCGPANTDEYEEGRRQFGSVARYGARSARVQRRPPPRPPAKSEPLPHSCKTPSRYSPARTRRHAVHDVGWEQDSADCVDALRWRGDGVNKRPSRARFCASPSACTAENFQEFHALTHPVLIDENSKTYRGLMFFSEAF